MENGGRSNLDDIKYKYNRRPKSGQAIHGQEANASGNIPTADGGNPSVKRESDQCMPIANVMRIMRRMLPPHAKVAEDAKDTMQECITEFISFVTSEANAKCHQEYRKTVTPEDVLNAMGTLGFDNYAETLTNYLNKYRAQDPDRTPMPPLQYVRRDPPSIVQRPVAQRPFPPPPPPPVPQRPFPPPIPSEMNVRPYVPLPLPTYGGYSQFPVMNNYYMGMGSRSGGGSGEGCSKDMEEFDPFK